MQSTNLPRRWSRTTKQSAIYGEFCGILSNILWNFVVFYRTWQKDMRGSDWPKRHLKQLCGGMEISCRLVFTCSSKEKMNRLKELLESKIRR